MTTPNKLINQGRQDKSPKADKIKDEEDLKNRQEKTEKSRSQLAARRIQQEMLEADDDDTSTSEPENLRTGQRSEKPLDEIQRPPLRPVDNIRVASDGVPMGNQPNQVPRIKVSS